MISEGLKKSGLVSEAVGRGNVPPAVARQRLAAAATQTPVTPPEATSAAQTAQPAPQASAPSSYQTLIDAVNQRVRFHPDIAEILDRAAAVAYGPLPRQPQGQAYPIPMARFDGGTYPTRQSSASQAVPTVQSGEREQVGSPRGPLAENISNAVTEAIKKLSSKQKKLDMNKNGKLDAEDFKILRRRKSKKLASKKQTKK